MAFVRLDSKVKESPSASWETSRQSAKRSLGADICALFRQVLGDSGETFYNTVSRARTSRSVLEFVEYSLAALFFRNSLAEFLPL
jgi:hypothetical protein